MTFQYFEHVLHCGHTCITDSEDNPELCPYCDKHFIEAIERNDPRVWSKRCKKGKPYCVYLISDGFYTKIGVTQGDARARIKELQTGNARTLQVIGYAGEFRYRHKAFELEHALHKLYENYRCNGEWFNLSKHQIESITNTTIRTDFYELKEFRRKFSRGHICPNCGAPLAYEDTKGGTA